MDSAALSRPAAKTSSEKTRLYYLDWLRVIAILAVFVVHVSAVFSTVGFEIKNAEQSEALTIILGILFPWGMPLFFLVAGAGSFFSLRHRTARQFTRERTLRLLVPFCTGTFLLGWIQLYLSWRHRTETGVIDWTFLEFLEERVSRIGPKLFGAFGYHMWFLGFLFAFSLLALPLFVWFKGETGQRAVSRLAGLCQHRGGILLFALLLVVVRLALQPFFPISHDWADFVVFGLFFVLGYVVFADQRFMQAIRRDWLLILIVLVACTAAFGMIIMSIPSLDLEKAPVGFLQFLLWALVSVCGWCGTTFMLFIGMRFLDRDNRALQYCLDILLPFFVLHQTVILVIAYFVVQWNMGLWPKLLVVFISSFAVTLAFCEFVVKRVGILRGLFGMKPARVGAEQVQSALAPR
jgi:glucans biosynthesis protein C